MIVRFADATGFDVRKLSFGSGTRADMGHRVAPSRARADWHTRLLEAHGLS